jgi:hypothetical protein
METSQGCRLTSRIAYVEYAGAGDDCAHPAGTVEPDYTERRAAVITNLVTFIDYRKNIIVYRQAEGLLYDGA